jgi:hypothetical protein
MVEELVQEAGILIVFLAGISYVAVGIYLLQTAARENGGPSYFLGWALLFNGFSFGLAEIGFVADYEVFLAPLTFAGRICAAACCVSIALFTWKVFRRDSGWGGYAVGFSFTLILIGLMVSALEGDWEGYAPLSSRGFWFEWVGSAAVFVWLAFESIRQHLVSRRRIPLGLIDPIVSNRYFLIGFYSSLASITYFIYIPMYIVYELHGVWSGWLDLSLGVLEVISVMALWLAFATPRFYRRRIEASAASAQKN